jgi:hypothetical protein
LSNATKRPIVAILGRDIFDTLLVDIDFAQRKIAFRNPAIPTTLPGAQMFPLPKGQFGIRQLSISVNGGRSIAAMFDLGSDIPLILSPEYVRVRRLLEGKRTSTWPSVGTEGIIESTVSVIDNVQIGGTSLSGVPIEVPQKWAQAVSAVVGVPILSRFRLMTDFGRDLIWMLPSANAESQPFNKDRLGFAAVAAQDSLRVVHVSTDSPAAKAGIRVGDEIVAVDGQKVDARYLASRARQGTRPAGTIIHYTLRTGANITITLTDYY